MFGLEPVVFILLVLCLLAACAFEFVNGFHDTANAVATVIYTNSLRPWVAVVWSGFCNFCGVMLGGIGVAMGIINLLPIDALVDTNVFHGIALILAMLISAIIWNLGTWYFGLPASSSHTLIGSIIGVGIAFSLLPGSEGAGVNWSKAGETGLALLISPLLGFGATYLLVKIFKATSGNKTHLFEEPKKETPPPLLIRIGLVITCTMVSFFHGSNDGQKGVGLVMLILIVVLPAYYAVNQEIYPPNLKGDLKAATALVAKANPEQFTAMERKDLAEFAALSKEMENALNAPLSSNLSEGNAKEVAANRFTLRKDVILLSKRAEIITKRKEAIEGLTLVETEALKNHIKALRKLTDYAPFWVTLMISLSLGIGTMVGWKRIVLTIGEKIGKSHLSYAQGFSAELVAASTIGMSSGLGLPVSTTHTLSSGIAGSMVATSGTSNLQASTVKNILLAWLLTLPVCILMSGGLFLLFRALF